MKTGFSIAGLRATAWASATFLSLTLAAEAKAQSRVLVTPLAAVQGGTIANPNTTAGMLQEAYGLLATADHDYKGHRAQAMKHVEAAAKLLGVKLHGDGKVREPQVNSDAQLRSAQALLAQAASGLTGRGLTHLQQAVRQLNVALAIR
jgi:hypothetical protein